MNLGSKILELRRQKNVTQEELAAELGVTAAAVSKWENGYTLPDILMLCALADYFAVTTDELLGRTKEWKYAVIAARTEELGRKVQALARSYGIAAKAIYTTYAGALNHTERDDSISVILVSLDEPLSEKELNISRSGVARVDINCDTEEEILEGFDLYLQHMDVLAAFGEKGISARKFS